MPFSKNFTPPPATIPAHSQVRHCLMFLFHIWTLQATLMDNVKMDRIPTEIKWKLHALFKGYLCYKMITFQDMSSEASETQIKIFFIS